MKKILNSEEKINFFKKTSCLSYDEQAELYETMFKEKLTKGVIIKYRNRFNLTGRVLSSKYTTEQLIFLKKRLPNVFPNEIIKEYYDKYHIKLENHHLRYLKKKFNIKTTNKTPDKITTIEQEEYLKSIVKDRFCYEIIDMFYEKYGIKLTKKQLSHIKRRLGIRSNTANKVGKNFHWNMPIGYEYKTKRGETYVKVGNPSKYQTKQRYVYEQHYGKIPNGYQVIFLDQNQENFDINNLKIISRSQIGALNGAKLLSNNEELNETSILLSKLMSKNAKIKKNMI